MPKGQSPREGAYVRQRSQTKTLLKKIEKDLNSLDWFKPANQVDAAAGFANIGQAVRRALRAAAGKPGEAALKDDQRRLKRYLVDLDLAKSALSGRISESDRSPGKLLRLDEGMPATLPKRPRSKTKE